MHGYANTPISTPSPINCCASSRAHFTRRCIPWRKSVDAARDVEWWKKLRGALLFLKPLDRKQLAQEEEAWQRLTSVVGKSMGYA